MKRVTIVIENLNDTEYMDLVKRVNEFRERMIDVEEDNSESDVVDFSLSDGITIRAGMIDELKIDFSTKIDITTFRPESAAVKIVYRTPY